MGIPFAPDSIILPALREDISLQAAPPGRDGAPHWNLYDPVRNCFFRIGWLEFELLSRWQDGARPEALSAAVSAATPLSVDAGDVLALLEFLQNNELLRAGQLAVRDKLLKMAAVRRLSAWKWLLHHYLFFRIPLVKPEAFLGRTLPHLGFLFRPTFYLWVGALSLFGLVRVINQWEEFRQTFLYFFSWQGAIYYGLALVLTKTVHELAHAYTAKHFGLRVPTMGIAFMVMWPLLYTDTSEGWKLASRRARLAIDGAGVAAELCLAGLALLAWSLLPEGPLKSAAYILAAVTWISTLVINLNPFMRFDGYYLLMDTVDMPNLQQRSFSFGRWQLRRWLLGTDEEIPEMEYESKRAWLVAYAYATWLYRLVVFTGIAIAVYYFFFKLLGIILFMVEIGWFVLLPVWKETRKWADSRDRWRHNAAARRSVLVIAGLAVILLLPWRGEVDGPGYLQADPHTGLYPPVAARLIQVKIKEGQAVRRGEILFELDSPEVEWKMRAAASRVAGMESSLAGSVDNSRLQERSRVLEGELNAARSERTAQQEEASRLRIAAPSDGVFRDLAEGLYPGAWLAPQRLLGRVVGSTGALAQVFVGEADVRRIQIGAQATLVTRRPDASSVSAEVVGIDEVASRALSEPMLASVHGGPIAVRTGLKGELIPNEAIYRVTLRTPAANVDQRVPVVAHIDGERSSLLWELVRRAASLIVREAGF
ncbi:MAG: peptidase [Rhodocyclaceae bacterium]|nr:peptidase [Rhodocyclaceae bacterium]